ncbi:hypothetical protein ACFORO_25950 [Amycolatopsis halotolerans]|uniref:DUF2188 domain-containing protein n=1 Tax=Amycolatopsis halotolerans TaxID=330083 RepID=A0ABV7QNY3_9PSEU
MSEAEYHPADPHFNPAHPDHDGWARGAKAPQMPAEAQIVRDFAADPDQAPAAEAGIVQALADGVIAAEHVALPDGEPDDKPKPKTSRKQSP